MCNLPGDKFVPLEDQKYKEIAPAAGGNRYSHTPRFARQQARFQDSFFNWYKYFQPNLLLMR